MTLRLDHLVHLLDIGIEERRRGADARIVDQGRDAGIRAQQFFDPGQIGLVAEIGRDNLDGAPGFVGQALGQRIEPLRGCGRQGSNHGHGGPAGRHRSRRCRKMRR